MGKAPEFTDGATNVYRTNEFIVKQCVVLRNDDSGTYLFSHDTYYCRTAKRDREYEAVFSYRQDKNGARIPTKMYSRKYVR